MVFLYKLDDKQQQATDPEAFVWANANAGTGKTTVLTNRVLRLLLAGTRPSKILCLTYTKAAASEMQNRIIERLRFWVTLEEKLLADEISTLTGVAPANATLKHARGLFVAVMEQSEGLNVQTIHAFAQSLLRRFPIEAGVSPYFRIIDDQESKVLLSDAIQLMLKKLQLGELEFLKEAAQELLEDASEVSLSNMLSAALANSLKWQQLISHPGGILMFESTIRRLLGLTADESTSSIKSTFEQTSKGENEEFAAVIAELDAYTSSLKKNPEYLDNAIQALKLRSNGLQGEADTKVYISAFLTKNFKRRSHLEKFSNVPQATDLFQKEFERCEKYVVGLANLRSLKKTLSYYAIVQVVFAFYQALASRAGVLDYQLLLSKAEQLLQKESLKLGWVMFKLDGGLEHILVDEAQDTSPEQWRIIQALANEFFTGAGQEERTRTLFVVGDEKQSIFSFQGADVAEFRKMKTWFKEQTERASQVLETIALETSYRSAPQIIEAVNHTTSKLQFEGVHYAREGAMDGRVIMLPLVEKNKESEEAGTEPEEDADDEVQVQLGKKIAAMIVGWFGEGKMIPSKGRTIQPQDIMVLVRRRSSLVQTLSNELKRNNIAVQGMDRFVLNQSLVIQDLIAFGRWLTIPEDDYGLACILRSPIGGLSEEELFELAFKREGSLWAALNAKAGNKTYDFILTMLKYYLNNVDYIDPYKIFYSLLIKDKKICDMQARLGEDTESLCYEFLEQALQYQSKQPSSMQGFIQYMEQQSIEIKRSHALPNAVRIMTVHGSKGLEAPIVIMGDTADAAKPREDISWVEVTGGTLPLCLPPKDLQNNDVRALSEASQVKHDAEYQRLLYVAITRAKDELYVTGYRGKQSKYDSSWYAILSEALQNTAEFLDDFPVHNSPAPLPCIMENTEDSTLLPAFLKQDAPPPIKRPTKLKASALEAFQDEVEAELKTAPMGRAREFGILMHEAIELMFSQTSGNVTLQHIENTLQLLPEATKPDIRLKLHTQLSNLITHDSTAFLFKQAERLVETPMEGNIVFQGRVERVSPVIDLCVFDEDMIWLIDFKTAEHIPQNITAVSKNYIRQLAVYRDLLKVVFPEKKIRSALVWTAGPVLEELPAELLDAELLDVALSAA